MAVWRAVVMVVHLENLKVAQTAEQLAAAMVVYWVV